ncbi:MAG: MarR family transcriptional regulator [Actinomycetota bacterium]|nr:MarR family transcriptional regulator [Actinomycetota bacterium]
MVTYTASEITPASRELVEALLGASRALVGVAVSSLAACDADVTLAQYRTLLVLSARGPQRVAQLAEATMVSPPNATRICSRLSGKGLVRRSRSPADRRSVRVSLTARGREVVARVSEARRTELGRVIAGIPEAGREQLIDALRAFTAAATRQTLKEDQLVLVMKASGRRLLSELHFHDGA